MLYTIRYNKYALQKKYTIKYALKKITNALHYFSDITAFLGVNTAQ